MTSHFSDPQPIRLGLDEEQAEVVTWLKDHLPLEFKDAHCGPARKLLGWSIEDLSSASGVTSQSIQRLERGEQLKAVSMQALAFALGAEGLMFFPGHPPLKGENCRGSTKDPRDHSDYPLLE